MLATGCAEKTPQEKVAEARAAYIVELNSWFPREPEPEPVAEEAPAEGEAAEGEAAAEASAEAEAADGAADGEGEAEMEILDVDADTGPRAVNVFFDLLVNFEGDEPLDGLTLDVSHADGSGAEKKSWRHYVELPAHIKGETKQVSFETEGVEFEEGDQFSVILRKVVPPDEQGDYREFASAGS
ncbi:MAG: hypothetical protein AAFY88_14335 [Acidobacteriota bacterium]